MRNLVTIDNGVIDQLLRTPAVARAIPCLAKPPPAKGFAPCCGGYSGHVDYGAIKQCLALLDSAGLKLVKEALGARQIRIFRSTTHRGRPGTVRHTR